MIGTAILKMAQAEPVLVLESPIAKPFRQLTSFFIAVGLPNTIQHNIPKKNEVL